MEYTQLIGATAGMLTLAGGIITIYVTHEKKLALSRQQNIYTQQQVNKLEKRVADLEEKIFAKLDKMNDSMEEIKIKIAKL